MHMYAPGALGQRHQHRWPVHTVKPENVFPNEMDLRPPPIKSVDCQRIRQQE